MPFLRIYISSFECKCHLYYAGIVRLLYNFEHVDPVFKQKKSGLFLRKSLTGIDSLYSNHRQQ